MVIANLRKVNKKAINQLFDGWMLDLKAGAALVFVERDHRDNPSWAGSGPCNFLKRDNTGRPWNWRNKLVATHHLPT